MNKYTRYTEVKKMANDFEAMLKLFPRNRVVEDYATWLHLPLDSTVVDIRKRLAENCKFWKLSCRYPLQKNEVLIWDLNPSFASYLAESEIKLPQKVTIRGENNKWVCIDGYWMNPTIMVETHKGLPILLGLSYFKTTNSYHNQMIKKV